MNLSPIKNKYRSELLDHVIPFWQNYSLDHEHGGYFTCLLPDGKVYDTDKFIWLQARQVWTFSMLYINAQNLVDQSTKDQWLKVAIHGASFLQKYGRDKNGHWYFSLDKKGAPLVQPYNIFSDCFAAMAFAQLHRATGQNEYAEIATSTFQHILKRKNNPKGHYEKTISSTRSLKNFALPMIMSNLVIEMENLIEDEIISEVISSSIEEVMSEFYQSETGLVYENVHNDGTPSDTFEGRLLNPGHAIEACWFMMDLANKINDINLGNQAVEIMLKTLDFGWDDEYGGIFYFMDRKGFPPQQLEWDQKLWWVHLESLVACKKGYELSGEKSCLDWFEKIHDYAWTHFRDSDNGGEWYGYLNRQGEKLLQLKGGKWKGCFHVPRALFLISQ